MIKKNILLVIFSLIIITDANAQWGGERSSISLACLYDWQTDKGSLVALREATSVGVRVMLEGELNDYWTYRLHATVPGLLGGDGYDRFGYGAVDLSLSLTNCFSWYMESDLYAVFGMGLTYGVSGADLLGFCVETGLGWTYWFGDTFGTYAEIDASFYSGVNSISLDFGLGLRIRL